LVRGTVLNSNWCQLIGPGTDATGLLLYNPDSPAGLSTHLRRTDGTLEEGSLITSTCAAGQGSITVPGCIAATPVEGPIDVEEGMPIDLPLVFCYGHQTPTENPELYKAIVEKMSNVLDKRVSKASAEAGITQNIIFCLLPLLSVYTLQHATMDRAMFL
jgi:hypothetical protein